MPPDDGTAKSIGIVLGKPYEMGFCRDTENGIAAHFEVITDAGKRRRKTAVAAAGEAHFSLHARKFRLRQIPQLAVGRNLVDGDTVKHRAFTVMRQRNACGQRQADGNNSENRQFARREARHNSKSLGD